MSLLKKVKRFLVSYEEDAQVETKKATANSGSSQAVIPKKMLERIIDNLDDEIEFRLAKNDETGRIEGIIITKAEKKANPE